MKRLALILLSVMAILSVGCNKNVEPPKPLPNQTDIVVTGDINEGVVADVPIQNAATRAETTKSKTSFVAGDMIGIFVVPFKNPTTPGDLVASGNYADNVAFIRNAAGEFAPSVADRITFPTANTHISIYAFAMYSTKYNTLSATPKSQPFSVSMDQSAANGVEIVKNDLMTAQATDVAPGVKPNLLFAHRMAMVRVDFTTLAAYRGGNVTAASVKINNVFTDALVDMTDTLKAPLVSGGTKNDVKAFQFSSAANVAGGLDCVFEAVLVPQTVVQGAVGITITLTTANPAATYDFKCELPQNVVYASGKLTKIKLSFDSEYRLTLTSADIKPWGDGGSVVVGARKPAVMNFKVAADPNSKAATIRFAELGIDKGSYTAEVKLEGDILKCNYMQPENKIGDKLVAVTFQNANKQPVLYQSAVPQVAAPGVIIFGDPTQQNYAEIISALTFN